VSIVTPAEAGAPDSAEGFDAAEAWAGEDLLLRRVVESVRSESARSARRRVTALACAAGLVLLAAVGAGVAVGQRLGDRPGSPWPETWSAADPRSGATLTARIAAGEGGAALGLSVSGLPGGTACRVTVLGWDGSRTDDGGWRLGGHPVSMATGLDPAGIAGIEVRADDGVDLVARP
jgi:hypothetical protein